MTLCLPVRERSSSLLDGNTMKSLSVLCEIECRKMHGDARWTGAWVANTGWDDGASQTALDEQQLSAGECRRSGRTEDLRTAVLTQGLQNQCWEML